MKRTSEREKEKSNFFHLHEREAGGMTEFWRVPTQLHRLQNGGKRPKHVNKRHSLFKLEKTVFFVRFHLFVFWTLFLSSPCLCLSPLHTKIFFVPPVREEGERFNGSYTLQSWPKRTFFASVIDAPRIRRGHEGKKRVLRQTRWECTVLSLHLLAAWIAPTRTIQWSMWKHRASLWCRIIHGLS